MGLILLGSSFLLGVFFAFQNVSAIPFVSLSTVIFVLLVFCNKDKQNRLMMVFCWVVLLGGFWRGQPENAFIFNVQDTQPLVWFVHIRNLLADSLANILPEPQCSLAQALLLGIRDNMPSVLRDDFARTGTTHIMAISGLHISIVTGVFLSIGVSLFGRRHYYYLILPLCVVWGYTLLCGASPSVLRAAIMATLFLVAESIGRQRSAPVTLIFAAAVMVGIQPALLGDLSFQMSFLGMSGLIFLSPWFHDRGLLLVGKVTLLKDSGFITTIIDSVAVSLGAVIATAPLIAYYFQTFSLATLPATILILPVITPIIILSFIVALLGIFLVPVAYVLGWVVWLFTGYIAIIVQWFAGLPYVALPVDINVTGLWLYYILLILIIGRRVIIRGLDNVIPYVIMKVKCIKTAIISLSSRRSFRKWTLLTVGIIAILLWVAVFTLPDGDLHVSFIDVGQGDAIFIQQGSQQILIDGGPDAEKVSLELGKRMPFWDRRIELVVLTHAQDDHISGLLSILERYEVDTVIEPGVAYDTENYQQWLKLIERNNIDYITGQSGQYIDMGGGVRIDILHPQSELSAVTESDINNSSVVLRLVKNKAIFLFTGDIEETVEYELLHTNGGELHSTVLKVAHHGSDSSTTQFFLDAVKPQIAVISVGENNRFGHPDAGVLSRLEDKLGPEKVYLTMQHGTVTFITDGERMWVETER